VRELDLVFGGRVFCDLVMAGVSTPAPGAEVFAESLTLTPGGTATRAVAAARLGFTTALVGAVGTDQFGATVRDHLARENNLTLDWLAELPGVQTAVTVALTNPTDRSFITYEERATWLPQTLPTPLPAVGACHVGVAEGIPSWVQELRRAGSFVVGGVGWDESGAWDPAVLDRLEHLDAFVPNHEEALNYTRSGSLESALRSLSRRTPLVVITRGGEGAVALDSATGERCELAAPQVKVVDPTGAGDCFVAALSGARTAGWPLQTCVAFAVLAASESVQRPGGAAGAPRAAELARRIRSGLEHEDLPRAEWNVVLAHLDATTLSARTSSRRPSPRSAEPEPG